MESGTVEQTLPGLGAPESPAAAPVGARAVALTSSKRLMIVAGRSNPDLARRIGLQIGCELGEVTLTTFASGETYCRYEDSIRGAEFTADLLPDRPRQFGIRSARHDHEPLVRRHGDRAPGDAIRDRNYRCAESRQRLLNRHAFHPDPP